MISSCRRRSHVASTFFIDEETEFGVLAVFLAIDPDAPAALSRGYGDRMKEGLERRAGSWARSRWVVVVSGLASDSVLGLDSDPVTVLDVERPDGDGTLSDRRLLECPIRIFGSHLPALFHRRQS